MRIISQRLGARTHRPKEHQPAPSHSFQLIATLICDAWNAEGNCFEITIAFDGRRYTIELDRKEAEALHESLTTALAQAGGKP